MTTEETVRTELGIPKDQFLRRLSQEDQTNVTQLAAAFSEAMRLSNRSGALIVVGGIMNKPHPRKDIDMVFVNERKEEDPKREDYKSRLEFALSEFRQMKETVMEITSNRPELIISTEMEPAIDEEYQNPNILKNDGSITLKGQGGLPIELIRDPKGSFDEQVAKQTAKFCILARVK